MSFITTSDILKEAEAIRPDFERSVHKLAYEVKGILFSEMLFIEAVARIVGATRLVESGTARGQSTVILATRFPHCPILSYEHDADSPDVAVARARLAGLPQVELCFGDAVRELPRVVTPTDVVLIDGPKGFRAIRLALDLLGYCQPKAVLLHDVGRPSHERAFLESAFPGAVYSDAPEFTHAHHSLDTGVEEAIPLEHRYGANPEQTYGFSVGCLFYEPHIAYRWKRMQASWTGFWTRSCDSIKKIR